jgi:hypothetical protein
VSKLIIALVAGTAGLFVSSADAAPLTPMTARVDGGVENVRMVCDEYGRCWRERGERRMMIQRESHGYDQNYGNDRRRRHHHDHSGPGFGIQAPGVSIGIGSGRW